MAEDISDSERLALVEQLLLILLAERGPQYPWGERRVHLQEFLELLLERSIRGQTSQIERPPSGPKEFSQVSSHVLELEQRLTTLERRLDATSETQREILLTMSASPALASMPFRRIVPAHVYLGVSESNIALPLERSLAELAESIGLDVIYEGPIEYNSWFRTILTRTKGALTQEEVQQRLGKVERSRERWS